MSWVGKTIVVTGGAGAIGSRLVKRLLDAGAARVFVIDDLSSGHPWLMPGYKPLRAVGGSNLGYSVDGRVTVLRRDVASADLMTGIPFAVDAVFHLAAHFANQNSVEQPFADLHGNALGTLRALDGAAKNRAGRFVFAAAGCAAGHRETPYQIHKALGEDYCSYFADHVPTVVCRFHNSYGPGEVPGRYRNVIPNFIWAAMHDRPLTVFGSGSDARDFVFVDDLVEFLVRDALPTLPIPERLPRAALYEIGTGVKTTIADLAELVVEVTGSKSEIVYGAPRRRWDHAGRAAEVPIATTVSLREGVERTYKWMAENAREIRESTR